MINKIRKALRESQIYDLKLRLQEVEAERADILERLAKLK